MVYRQAGQAISYILQQKDLLSADPPPYIQSLRLLKLVALLFSSRLSVEMAPLLISLEQSSFFLLTLRWLRTKFRQESQQHSMRKKRVPKMMRAIRLSWQNYPYYYFIFNISCLHCSFDFCLMHCPSSVDSQQYPFSHSKSLPPHNQQQSFSQGVVLIWSASVLTSDSLNMYPPARRTMSASMRQMMTLVCTNPPFLPIRNISSKHLSIYIITRHKAPDSCYPTLDRNTRMSIFDPAPQPVLSVDESEIISFNLHSLHEFPAGGTVINLFHPLLQALGMHQPLAAPQSHHLLGPHLLQTHFALRLILEERVRQRILTMLVPPTQHLLCLSWSSLGVLLASASETNEDMHEDGACKESHVGICHHYIIPIMLQHPILTLQFRLARQGTRTGAAPIRIHLRYILRRTDSGAAEV